MVDAASVGERRSFTYYWRQDQCSKYVIRGWTGNPVFYAVSNRFTARGIHRGDWLYIVTSRLGKLCLIGRLEVGRVTTRSEALKKLGPNIFDADEVVIAYEGTGTPMHFESQVPDAITRNLLFIGPSGLDHLKFEAPDSLDRQTLRGIRELTAQSASALDKLIGQRDGPKYTLHRDDA